MKGVKKQDLPSKICAICNRPFTWRKKWEKNWEDVKYCSDACRKLKSNKTKMSESFTEHYLKHKNDLR